MKAYTGEAVPVPETCADEGVCFEAQVSLNDENWESSVARKADGK
jgi:hypothetical protein